MQWERPGPCGKPSRDTKTPSPGRTVMAAPAWSLGARFARDALGIPLATCVLNVFLLRSTLQPPVTPHDVDARCYAAMDEALSILYGDTFIIEPLLGPEIRRFSAELGLAPPTRYMNRWWFSPDLVLWSVQCMLCPRPSGLACHVELVGAYRLGSNR